jgi:Cu-Zn family superoxide dismutase
MADANGVAEVNKMSTLVKLMSDAPNSVINKSIVVHAGEDDLGLGGDTGSTTTGNAGGRVACGVIDLMQRKGGRGRGPPGKGKRGGGNN